jgi:hypothetical protein
VRGLQDEGRCVLWRDLGSGMSGTGMRAAGLAGNVLQRTAVAGSFIRRSRLEVLACPHGCQDQASSEAFRWRAALAGMGCRTGILRPDSRDHLQAAISAAWSRPIDPPAAARLSLGQAGEFTKCLLSGDFVLLHRNRRRSPLSGHVAFSPGLLPTMRVPAIGNPGRDGSMRMPGAAMRHG